MRSNKPDQYGFDCKLDDSHYSVIVSFNVEYISLVAYIIYSIECFFYIGKTCPLLLFYHPVPVFQRYFGIGVLGVKILQGLFRYDSHLSSLFYATKIQNKYLINEYIIYYLNMLSVFCPKTIMPFAVEQRCDFVWRIIT